MRILLVSATKEEIQPSLSYLDHHQIDYLITGVGMVATAFKLGYYLKDHVFDLIINVGIAGSFVSEVTIGSVVRVVSDNFIEMGAEDNEQFIPIDKMGLGHSTYQEYLPENILKKLPDFPHVHGITVNCVHGNSMSISKIKSKFPSLTVESMEGAAVFYVANAMQLPVIQLRSISNYVEPRDKSRWNIPLAIKELNHKLISLLESLV